jgi:hypothetical protein
VQEVFPRQFLPGKSDFLAVFELDEETSVRPAEDTVAEDLMESVAILAEINDVGPFDDVELTPCSTNRYLGRSEVNTPPFSFSDAE